MTKFTDDLATFYAPPELANREDVLIAYKSLMDDPKIRMFQNAMPDVALILNKQRQLVYANDELLQMFELNENQQAIGMRPGQLFDCIHSKETIYGCGTSESCKYCGLVNAVLDSQKSGRPSIHEAKITAGESNNLRCLDLQIKASPFTFQDVKYTIVALKDISDKKRRGILETTYFDEILNTVSSLKELIGKVKIIQTNDDKDNSFELAEKINYGLFENLMAKKALIDAEEGKLEIKSSRCNSIQLLKDMDQYFSIQTIAYQKKFFIDPFSHSVYFETDMNILKRVMVNLIMNAFEASLPGMVVKTGSKLTDKTINFWIHNQAEMSNEVKLQVFQRYFTTKGKNRGLGAFESKLLVSRYLHGEILLTSNNGGTTFSIKLPLKLD